MTFGLQVTGGQTFDSPSVFVANFMIEFDFSANGSYAMPSLAGKAINIAAYPNVYQDESPAHRMPSITVSYSSGYPIVTWTYPATNGAIIPHHVIIMRVGDQ